jgi:hypothetical protein
MCGKGFFKRAVPFFLTFLVGVLIAGIFVPIGSPNFQFRKRGWQNHREQHERMDSEMQRLRDENERLRKQLSEIKEQNLIEELDVPPPPLPSSKIKTVTVKELDVDVKTVKKQ